MAEEAKNRPRGRPCDAAGAALTAVRKRMLRLAVKLVWNRDDAEDIVQEALRIAIEKGPAATDERFAAWMIRTVANCSLNWRRKKRPAPLRPEHEPAALTSPAAGLVRAEELQRLRAAIETLPAQQRLAIVLRTMEQMSYEDVAAAMDLTPAAVRTHVHLARRQLLRIMQGESK